MRLEMDSVLLDENDNQKSDQRIYEKNEDVELLVGSLPFDEKKKKRQTQEDLGFFQVLKGGCFTICNQIWYVSSRQYST